MRLTRASMGSATEPMSTAPHRPQIAVHVVGEADHDALGSLRALWVGVDETDPGFDRSMESWLAEEGARRTTWVATLGSETIGMASLFEYRSAPGPGTPESRWGYVSNIFVREEHRNRGVGTILLDELVATADALGYERLTLSPGDRSMTLYERAGFVVADEEAATPLLVRVAAARARRAS